ncbi:hypothetical protein [Ralstonia pseudosolanacearum]|uniref:hypothetical protein n=1 Tax=Ralstonia pseudosolanacearum TaxID=1310165 RepID=UPI001FFB7A6C|nr:hypothetical protein [Ralstonia pseudosolanacearum]
MLAAALGLAGRRACEDFAAAESAQRSQKCQSNLGPSRFIGTRSRKISILRNHMDQLPPLLAALPKEMQGSLMTIAGGVVTALFGGIGWLAKTWNDRCKERVKRQMEMRREVFMPAAECIAEAMGFAGALPNDMRPENEIQADFSRLARKIALLQIVGSNATIQANGEFAAKFAAFFMAAMSLRHRVQQARIAGHFALAPDEKAKWAEAAASYSNQPLADLFKQHLKPLQLAHGALLLAMREELSLKTDKKQYLKTLDSVERQIMTSFDDARSKVFSKPEPIAPAARQ